MALREQMLVRSFHEKAISKRGYRMLSELAGCVRVPDKYHCERGQVRMLSTTLQVCQALWA